MPRRLARRLVRLLLLLQGLLLPGSMLGLLERMTLLPRHLRHLRHLRLLLLLLVLLLLVLLLLPGLVHRLLLAPAGIEGVEVHGLQPGLCAAAGLVQIIGEPLASAGSEDAFRRGSRASAAIDSHLGLHGGPPCRQTEHAEALARSTLRIRDFENHSVQSPRLAVCECCA